MLVSATIGTQLREEVRSGKRPTPEYLCLESKHGVELLDWSRAGLRAGHRSAGRSMRHVAVALKRLGGFDVVFSDGEHLGIPLALSIWARRRPPRHVMIGHNLLTPSKIRILRCAGAGRQIDRVLVHSGNQVPAIAALKAVPKTKLAVVPYGVDTAFWSPQDDCAEELMVASAGREHRDYRTLVSSMPPDVALTIADHSPFTPDATREDPDTWPPGTERVALDPLQLRSLYGRAAVVVVPVVESPMPAGITTLLEAMSMGKAVVVTETPALRGVVRDGLTGVTVRPGDTTGMRRAIEALLSSPSMRQALGNRARQVAVDHYGVDVYADALARHLTESASSSG
jgi:glycosyltransferase involved in cell wall biosynthesis